MRKLANIAPEAHRAWVWLQQNQDKFEEHVYGPPLVECSIKDPRYLNQIETLFQLNTFALFTVQTKNDFKLLGDYVHDHLHLKDINIKTITNFDLSHFKPPIPTQELHHYGLDTWALDHFNGPEPVLAMLCAEIRIHAAALTTRDTTPQQYDMIRNSPIDSWVTSTSAYKITRRREYGAGAVSAQVRDLRKASMWTDQPVDGRARNDLQDNVQGWRDELETMKQEHQRLQAELVEVRNQISEKKQQHVSVWI